ncbi:hypothetical protein KFU94_01720 [Chloroflexi bacterium TSY]|nr:hypothetical protein [Chloroflexi bacterium TSY]
MPEMHEQLPTMKVRVQSLLTLQYNDDVELDAGNAFDENHHVWRFHLLNRPANAPSSVIVKQAYADARLKHFFYNEWVGLQFLSEVTTQPLVSLRICAGDWAGELPGIEDSGRGEELEEVVQGTNKDATVAALLDFATVLGHLHAQTCGQQTAYERVRKSSNLPKLKLLMTLLPFVSRFRLLCRILLHK